MDTPILDRMVSAPGYAALMDEIRMHDWDDPYGTASDWYLATGLVYWMETGEALNGLHPSPLYVQGDWGASFIPNGYNVERICEMLDSRETSLEDIKLVNDIITRYLAWCVRDGRDY